MLAKVKIANRQVWYNFYIGCGDFAEFFTEKLADISRIHMVCQLGKILAYTTVPFWYLLDFYLVVDTPFLPFTDIYTSLLILLNKPS